MKPKLIFDFNPMPTNCNGRIYPKELYEKAMIEFNLKIKRTLLKAERKEKIKNLNKKWNNE